MRAVARWLSFEKVRVAVETGRLREEASDIIARTIAQEQRRPGLDHCEMAPVSGHKQVRRGRQGGGNSSCGQREEPEEPK